MQWGKRDLALMWSRDFGLNSLGRYASARQEGVQ
jgi:hypothetical protein